MNIATILAILPWNLIREIGIAIAEMVADDTDNKYDDKLVDAIKNSVDKAECKHPDK